ncbi:glycosyl hydrolase family 3 [Pseudoalteromonas sp. MMG010]|uniref:glycoside hydrolase family 3 protein n=1 Tax=Pseudoalteromonas sp. MMG010 TaxID=2822685 RepID=UPI001B3A38F9|nr:glycoside hydrolase family 3 protein [Pseudoalteromonas sp. MMG010]MBQ4833652.1 glycosyl hydrolase family 3 [Pseudoalteromonas sp. MMG010]
MPFNSSSAELSLSLPQQIGQKLMLDFRYYCDNNSEKQCRTPMTILPKALAEAIAKYNIGGVILFSENTQSIEQTLSLNYNLQHAASQSSSQLPLFISIDQEGGRVARLPRDVATSFTGNMSIGATYEQHGTFYAKKSAEVIAAELSVLGINVNYAPTIDVNMNPNNPVINVRSFGEDPEKVALLGAAQVKGFENNGVISSLKHFPGHGDTNVDSHTGLPRVNHSKAVIYQQDLAPFKDIIANENPGMIMTAHIQYPALDDSTFISVDGKSMIKPATMSRTIMTDILRNEFNYQGVVITDALDMAGISQFFDPTQAVINTFSAGVDIALMPIEIRNEADLLKLDTLINSLVNAVKNQQLNSSEIATSTQRIVNLKNKFNLLKQKDKLTALVDAKRIIGSKAHRQLESELALEAVTQIKNDNNLLPLALKAQQHIHIIMPDTRKCAALEQALIPLVPASITFSCSSLQGFDYKLANQHIAQADIVIAGNATPNQSAVEIGGMDDLADNPAFAIANGDRENQLKALLSTAKNHNKKVVFISLRAPYDTARFSEFSDTILATYAYNIDVDDGTNVSGPAFSALAKILVGTAIAKGTLPVSINN